MVNLIDKLKIGAAITIGAPIVVGLAVVLSPVLVMLVIKNHFDDKEAQKKFDEDLLRLEGTCFFCYNNRKNSVAFVKEEIIPHLDASVQVVFVEGKVIRAMPDKYFISRILYGAKDKKCFPYLLKISDEKVLDSSIHQQLYNTLSGKKPTEPLLGRINSFYNSPITSA
ncbi:MAG: hypothetical protein ACRYFX_27090 [Janthinobacterium lividum]